METTNQKNLNPFKSFILKFFKSNYFRSHPLHFPSQFFLQLKSINDADKNSKKSKITTKLKKIFLLALKQVFVSFFVDRQYQVRNHFKSTLSQQKY